MRGMVRPTVAATVEKDKGVDWGRRAKVIVGVADGRLPALITGTVHVKHLLDQSPTIIRRW